MTETAAISLYVNDANGSVYLAEQVGWLEELDGEQQFHPIACRGIHSKADAVYRLTVDKFYGVADD